jgi:hypothetical protein
MHEFMIVQGTINVPKYVKAAEDHGYRVVTMSECLGLPSQWQTITPGTPTCPTTTPAPSPPTGLAVQTKCVQAGMVALTIDDGVNVNGYMTQIVDANPAVKLSFFINGENDSSYAPGSIEFRAAIQNAVSKGHEVCTTLNINTRF